MAPPRDSYRDSYRDRDRSRSPPPRRSSSYRDSRREGDYHDDRDRRGEGGVRAGSSRKDRDGYDTRRRHSRSTSPNPRPRPASPGRPSLQLEQRERERGPLPSQQELVSGAGAAGVTRGGAAGAGDGPGGNEPVKPIEPNFAPSGALAAETKWVQLSPLCYPYVPASYILERATTIDSLPSLPPATAPYAASFSNTTNHPRRGSPSRIGGCMSSKARSKLVSFKELLHRASLLKEGNGAPRAAS